MNHMRTKVAVAVTCALAAIAVPATARPGHAGVAAALKAQQKLIDASPAVKFLKIHPDVKTRAGAKKLISEFAALKGLMQHASTAVADATPATPTQKQAQQKIVTGLRQEARGVGTVETGLEELVAGHKTQAKETIGRGEKILSAGDLIEQSGVKNL